MRVVRAPAEAPGASVVAPDLVAGDIARQAQEARKALALARPLNPGERVDVDQAGAAELERLPRVGPALARRIVDERAARGPFGSLEGMKRVSGIGPSTLAGFERTAAFSGTARPGAPGHDSAAAPEPRGAAAARRSACPPGARDVNTASAADLACLPGIGPALAQRIVTWRTAHGPFREVQRLEEVPGIGAGRLGRLAPLLRVP